MLVNWDGFQIARLKNSSPLLIRSVFFWDRRRITDYLRELLMFSFLFRWKMVSGILKTLSLLFKVLVVHYRRSWRGSFCFHFLCWFIYSCHKLLQQNGTHLKQIYALVVICFFFSDPRFYPLVKLGHVLVSLEVKVMFCLLVWTCYPLTVLLFIFVFFTWQSGYTMLAHDFHISKNMPHSPQEKIVRMACVLSMISFFIVNLCFFLLMH